MSEWDQLDALLSNTDSPLPKCISFSVYPVFRFFSHHFDLEGWDRKIGEAAYDKNITIHFYQMDFAAKE